MSTAPPAIEAAAAAPATAPLSSLATVVIATRDRRDQLLGVLPRLVEVAPEERPAVVVVDNASGDGTVDAVRRRHPEVLVVALDRNEGAAARNIGAATAATEVVAFNDDDSWWAPGSLRAAATTFAHEPSVGLVAARVLVGDDDRLDPTSAAMAASPLRPHRASGATGRPILGFLACAVAVRRTAFLAVGGFSRTLFFLGEEDLVAIDLATAGWDLRYHDELVVHHRPDRAGRVDHRRAVQQRRNALLTTWLRRPLRPALARTLQVVRAARTDPVERAVLGALLRDAPTVRRDRRPVPRSIERDLRLLSRSSP